MLFGRELERIAVRLVGATSGFLIRSQPLAVMRNSYWPPVRSCWVLPKRPPRSYWMVRCVLPTKVRVAPSLSSTSCPSTRKETDSCAPAELRMTMRSSLAVLPAMGGAELAASDADGEGAGGQGRRRQ